MEVVLEKIESSRISVSGSSTDVKVTGVVTITTEKKVTDGNGSFIRVSDNVTIGNWNIYSGNNRNYSNMIDEVLTCACVMALNDYVNKIPTIVLQ